MIVVSTAQQEDRRVYGHRKDGEEKTHYDGNSKRAHISMLIFDNNNDSDRSLGRRSTS